MSMIQFTTTTNTAPELSVELSTNERLFRLAAEHDEARVFAVYHAVTRHLRGGGKNRLSNPQVAEMTPGCGINKARDCLTWLCQAKLLERDGDGNSAYYYNLPPSTGGITVLRGGQQSTPHVEGSTQRVEQSTHGVTNLEEEKEEDFVLDRNRKTAIEKIPNNEQARIARQFVKDPQVIAIAASLELPTVQHIAKQTRRDKIESEGDYFSYSIRNAPVKPPHSSKPKQSTKRYVIPGSDDTPPAQPETVQPSPSEPAQDKPEPAPVDAAPQAADPNGPVIYPPIWEPPAPRPEPDPEEGEDDVTRSVWAYWRQMFDRATLSTLECLTLAHNGQDWTLTAPTPHDERSAKGIQRHLLAYLADALCVDRDAVTLRVEAVSG